MWRPSAVLPSALDRPGCGVLGLVRHAQGGDTAAFEDSALSVSEPRTEGVGWVPRETLRRDTMHLPPDPDAEKTVASSYAEPSVSRGGQHLGPALLVAQGSEQPDALALPPAEQPSTGA